MVLWPPFTKSTKSVVAEHPDVLVETALTSHPVLDAIRRFLADETNTALAIYGPWGVGKTYTWKRLLDEALRSGRLVKRRYAYTSLFGIATLDALRASIFENTNWLLDPNVETAEIAELKRVGNFTLDKFKRHKYALAAIPYVGKVIQDAGPFYFATVRNQIICFDDVERRGSGLSVQDVLELVSFLKEQRDCKVIVLLNEGELGCAKSDFDKNAEKVFDVSLKFDPTPFEAAEIAIRGNDDLSSFAKQQIVLLGINNIRVICKIYLFLQELEPLLKNVKEPTAISARKSMILLGWVRFQPDIAPTRDFVFEKNLRHAWGLGESKLAPVEEGWRQLLSLFEFIGVDAVDRALMTSLDSGLIDKEVLQKLLSEADDDLEKSGRHSPLSIAWDYFRESFDNNEEEVVARLLKGVRETKFLSVGNLSATYNIISKLDREEEAKAMIDEFVKERTMPESFWDLSEHLFADRQLPDYVVNSFNAKHREHGQPPGVEQLLLSLGSGGGYNKEDLAYLVARPDESLIAVILNAQGDDLHRIVSGGLRFRRLGNQENEIEHQFTRKIMKVLKIIAGRSRIDLLRVKSLTGIALDDDLPD